MSTENWFTRIQAPPTLAGAITSSATSFTISDGTKLPVAPCRLLIDTEYIYATAITKVGANDTVTVGAPPESFATIAFQGSDLVVDGASNTKVTSASHSFTSSDVGSTIVIMAASPTAWTVANYTINSVVSGAAILSASPAAVSSTGGVWRQVGAPSLGRGIESSSAASHLNSASVRAPVTALGMLQAYEASSRAVSVINHGLVGNGSTDNAVAMQALINSYTTQNTPRFRFPVGRWNFKQTVAFPAQSVCLEGDGYSLNDAFSGTVILGDATLTGDMFQITGFQPSVEIHGINWQHLGTSAAGVNAACLHIGVMESGWAVGPCFFSGPTGGLGTRVDGGTLAGAFTDCIWKGAGVAAGLFFNGQGELRDCHTNNCTPYGVRWCGGGLTVTSLRGEVNNGPILDLGGPLLPGVGTSPGLQRAVICNLNGEGNLIGLKVTNAAQVAVKGCNVLGEPSGPVPYGLYGYLVLNATQFSMEDCTANGNWHNAGISVQQSIAQSSLGFKHVTSTSGGNPSWDLQYQGQFSNEDTNYTPTSTDSYTVAFPFITPNLVTAWLGKADFLNPIKEGANLRGKNVSVGNSQSSFTVTFPTNLSRPLVPTLATAAGGTLSGWYYYTLTWITEHGESDGFNPAAINVPGGGTGTVNVSYSGSQSATFPWAMRIYRGQSQQGAADATCPNGTAAAPIVSSATYKFTTNDIGTLFVVTAGTNWTLNTVRTINNNTSPTFTDLATSNGLSPNPVVTSASYAFGTGDVGSTLTITAGTNAITGAYPIISVSGGAATLQLGPISSSGNSLSGVSYKLTGCAVLSAAIGSVASLTSGTWQYGGGIFQGYFQMANNTLPTGGSPLVDTGAAFPAGQGGKSSPLVNTTSGAEPDGNYAAFVTTSWATLVNIASTDKTTTGFTAHFGTNSPGAGTPTIDWFIVR